MWRNSSSKRLSIPSQHSFTRLTGKSRNCRQSVDTRRIVSQVSHFRMGLRMMFHMRLGGACLALSLVIGIGCGDSARTVSVKGWSEPVEPPPPVEIRALKIIGPGRELFTGMTSTFVVQGRDVEGNAADLRRVSISLSDTSLATIVSSRTDSGGLAQNGRPSQSIVTVIKLKRAGTVRIIASTASIVEQSELKIEPIPLPTEALVVDSFYVAELQPCTPECLQHYYVPVIKLRETTMTDTATVVAFHIQVGNEASGLCGQLSVFGPGSSDYLFYFHPYVHNNDVVFGPPAQTSQYSSPATVHLIVKEEKGGYGLVTASGRLKPTSSHPFIPMNPQIAPSTTHCMDWGEEFP